MTPDDQSSVALSLTVTVPMTSITGKSLTTVHDPVPLKVIPLTVYEGPNYWGVGMSPASGQRCSALQSHSSIRPFAVASMGQEMESVPACTSTLPPLNARVLPLVEAMVWLATLLLNVRPPTVTSVSRLTVAPAVELSERTAISLAPGTVLFQLPATLQLAPSVPFHLNVLAGV